MPGSVLKLYIIFKSDKGGIFTEKWEFMTNPRMLGGASLILTLRGVAIQEDKFKKNRGIVEVCAVLFFPIGIYLFKFPQN